MSGGIATGNKLGRYRDKRLSFDSAQDDVTLSGQDNVTLSGVEVLSTLKFLYINLCLKSEIANKMPISFSGIANF